MGRRSHSHATPTSLVFALVLAASPANSLSSEIVLEITNVFADSLSVVGLGVGDLIEGDFSHDDCSHPL